jgi:predicted HTH domain antitoxin
MQNEHISRMTVEVPDAAGLTEQSLKEYLAAKLYGDGTLSLYEAAAMAGMKKLDFPKVLKHFGVPYFNLTPEELARDIANARPRNF